MLPPQGLFAGEEMEIEFRVRDTRPADPSKGLSAVNLARFHCEVGMPSMPSMARFEEIAHREGVPGVFGVHPTLPHGGQYRLCIDLEPSEALELDRGLGPVTFEFPLEVADAAANRRPQSARIHPFRLEVATRPERPVAGEEVEIELVVRMENSPDRRAATAFDLVHEKPMHLILVRSDLTRFSHEHPVPETDGTFRLIHRFSEAGEYRLFLDVAPKDAGSQILAALLSVRSPPGAKAAPAGPRPDSAVLAAETEGVRVELELPAEGLPAGRTVTVAAHLFDGSRRPIRDLEPWLGALGHLLLLHTDAETFAHAHPDERELGSGENGRIPFLVRLPKPGLYRGWLQFQRAGRVATAELALATTDEPAPERP